jgi:hypothetical protein
MSDSKLPPYEQLRFKEFVRKAELADASAAAAKNELTRKSWQTVAESYRDLAGGILRRFNL